MPSGLCAILPGDSLLFTVGLLVATGTIDHSLVFVCMVLTLAAIAGNACGYAIGRRVGPALFRGACGVTVLGYYLGQIPLVRANIEVALILIAVVSVIPMGVELVLHRRRVAGAAGV